MTTEHPMTESPRAVGRGALRVAREALPAYSSRYSRKDFTRRRRFAVPARKTSLRTDYRGVVALLGDFAETRGALGLSRAPDQSTPCSARRRRRQAGGSSSSPTAPPRPRPTAA